MSGSPVSDMSGSSYTSFRSPTMLESQKEDSGVLLFVIIASCCCFLGIFAGGIAMTAVGSIQIVEQKQMIAASTGPMTFCNITDIQENIVCFFKSGCVNTLCQNIKDSGYNVGDVMMCFTQTLENCFSPTVIEPIFDLTSSALALTIVGTIFLFLSCGGCTFVVKLKVT